MCFKKGTLELYARKWQAGPRREKHPLGKPHCWNVLKPNFPTETLEVRLWLEEEILLKCSLHSAFFHFCCWHVSERHELSVWGHLGCGIRPWMCMYLITVPLQRHVLILHKVIEAVYRVRFTDTAADCDNMFTSQGSYKFILK